MEKPIELKVLEFNDSMIGLINNSGLPSWYLVEKISNLLNEVRNISEREKTEAMMNYMNANKENDNGD